MNVMSHLHRNSIWQVELPDGWKVNALMLNCAAIYRPDGVGQIHVQVRPEEMEAPSLDHKSEDRYSGQLPGIHRRRSHGAGNWRSWTLFCGKHVLLIRYSCAPAHAGVEDEEVDLIVSSITSADGADQDQV